MNSVKERLCYVSQDYLKDLALTKPRKNSIQRDFVLPDYVDNYTGYIKGYETPEKPVSEEQILHLNNERICVPEILFNPSDIGLQQGGLADAVLQSIEACHVDLREGILVSLMPSPCKQRDPNWRLLLLPRPPGALDPGATAGSARQPSPQHHRC